MKKATYIKPEDLQNLQYDDNGNIIIPEGFEIYIKEDPAEVRQRRITELETQLKDMVEPTEQELIEGDVFDETEYISES
jgi:hypothetical protein